MKKLHPFATGMLSLLLVFVVGSCAYCATLHTVRDGETLESIAATYQIDTDTLRKANPDLGAKPLQPGQVVMIPAKEASSTESDGAGSCVDAMIRDSSLVSRPAAAKAAKAAAPAKKAKSAVARKPQRVSASQGVEVARQTMHRRRSLSSRHGSLMSGIVNTSVRYIGVPYRWAGTTSAGFDCSGFTMTVFKMNGMSLPRMADEQYRAGKPISDSEAMPGDLVFFATYTRGVSHVGIYMGQGYFIHASSSKGVVISHLTESYWRNRYLGARRYF